MIRFALLLLLLTPPKARAEGPWTVEIGAGPAVHRIPENYSPTPDDYTLGASMRLDAGYRAIEGAPAGVPLGLALGLHLGMSYVRANDYINEGMPNVESTFIPFEVGASAQLVIANRVVFSPWGGLLDLNQSRLHAFGASLGVDIVACGHDRISAVAGWGIGREGSVVEYITFSGGIAYRYW